jgi:hypothetical protein
MLLAALTANGLKPGRCTLCISRNSMMAVKFGCKVRT